MVNKNPPTYITIKYSSWVEISQLYFKLLHTSHVNHIINGFLFVISRKLLKVTNNYVDEISHAIMFWANIWYSLFYIRLWIKSCEAWEPPYLLCLLLLEPQKLFFSFSLHALYFKSSTYISWGYTIGCFSDLGVSKT